MNIDELKQDYFWEYKVYLDNGKQEEDFWSMVLNAYHQGYSEGDFSYDDMGDSYEDGYSAGFKDGYDQGYKEAYIGSE